MKIGTGRYSNLLARFLTGTAQLDVVPELSAEVSPVFVLEAERPEWNYLSGQRLVGGRGSQSATVGQPSVVRLRNPPGSNVLAVIDRFIVSTSLLGSVSARLGALTTDRSAALTVSILDSRWTGTLTAGALKLSQEGAAFGTGNEFMEASVLGSTPLYFERPIVLAPGSSLEVGCATLNVGCSVSFTWRERELTRYEI